MQKRVADSVIELAKGDITKETTDAIVNAANKALLGGGGVDGAIHRAGGPEILEECKKLRGCETGDAKITTAGKMDVKYVIHTVGPVYRDGKHNEPELLQSAHTRSLKVAIENGVRTISFPAISCGVYGYPIPEAAKIAITTTADFLRKESSITKVRFVLFNDDVYKAYENALANI